MGSENNFIILTSDNVMNWKRGRDFKEEQVELGVLTNRGKECRKLGEGIKSERMYWEMAERGRAR